MESGVDIATFFRVFFFPDVSKGTGGSGMGTVMHCGNVHPNRTRLNPTRTIVLFCVASNTTVGAPISISSKQPPIGSVEGARNQIF